MKQEVFSFRDRFAIKDEQGNDCYFADGRVAPLLTGQKLTVQDSSGKAVAIVEQKPKGLTMLRFAVEIDGREVCAIIHKFSLFRQKYSIEGLPWQLSGDFTAHEYELTNGSETVMSIDKKIISWGDSYELSIADPAHELLCLCIALAVDCSLAIRDRNR
jgi:uncharacterized protein YxjI